MKDTIIQLVNQINQTEKVVDLLEEDIFEIEMAKLGEIIELAMPVLQFTEIYEKASGDEGFYDGEEFFLNENGKILKGLHIFSQIEGCREIEECERELETELFLLEDGNLQVFYTIYESQYCDECEVFHCKSLRGIAKEQDLSKFDIEVIINNIANVLKSRVSFLDGRKKERMEKLKSLEKAL